ncbi:MAG: type II secretion system F family protein [Planctomycetes bacterium]|nr:type II secretion system F family protein [Planctomycetota bacterium]
MALFTSQSTAKSAPAAAHSGRQPQWQGVNISFDFGPSKKDILNFTNQLAVMVRAGISLQDALESIGNQIPKQKFRAVVLDLKSQIEGGECFSRALARYPDIFGNLYVNMIAAAEISGSMSAMLQQLVAYLDQESETRSQIIGAMVYPAIIATMAVSCVTFLLIFVLPRFLLVFAGKEDLLPAPTKLIMALSGGLRHYWFIIFPAIAAVILGFWYLTHRTDAGKFWWDKIKLRIPLLGTLCRSLYITRSMHTMGVLTNAGVPILDTISITALISGNILYERMWRGVHEAVRQGKKIAVSLAEYDLMPSNVVQMIQSGEESGSLGEVLKDIAEFYARQLRTVIKAATSMIEPLMIVMMGVLVGFIAMSIILPIFKMSSVVTSG